MAHIKTILINICMLSREKTNTAVSLMFVPIKTSFLFFTKYSSHYTIATSVFVIISQRNWSQLSDKIVVRLKLFFDKTRFCYARFNYFTEGYFRLHDINFSSRYRTKCNAVNKITVNYLDDSFSRWTTFTHCMPFTSRVSFSDIIP